MPCPENPEACCPPPGGSGRVVPGWLSVSGWPDEAGWSYLPWEVDATFAFQVTSATESHASGHIITYDALFKRLNAPVAQSQQQVDDYLALRAEQLAERAMRLAAAKVAFHNQAGVEWPDYVGGGVLIADSPLDLGMQGIFSPFSYPSAKCVAEVLGLDPVVAEARFPNGRRTIRGVTVVTHGHRELMEFLRMQQIWLPLYNAAIAAVDAEYPIPS